MASDPRGAPRPPRLLGILARLLIRGRDASYILSDMDGSFARDVERGLGSGRAIRRYASNAAASAYSVWSAELRGLGGQGLGLDAKLGLRMLAKQPLITAVTVVALGLGIPASLALLHGMSALYSAIPVPDGDRVMGLRHYDLNERGPLRSSLHDYERWQELESFESIGAVRSYSVNINAEQPGASPVRAAQITASSFDVLRVRPLLGRSIVAADELDGAPAVVLLGEDLWSARFGRDPDIVGQVVRIGRRPHVVVGVLPSDFRFPLSDQVWLPFRARAMDFPAGDGPRAFVFGRLASGVSVEAAEVELARLTESRATDEPERFERVVGEVVGMPILLLDQDEGLGTQTDAVLIQLLIFGLLLVVCGNVGTLILARTAARSAEITIRTALGASRARILTQLFVEALVLALAATGFGLLCADVFAAWLMRMQAPYGLLPYWADLTLTPRIVAMALGLATLSAVVAGVLPGLSATRRAIQPNLQVAGARSTAVPLGNGASLLIVSEIALSVGFLAMGGTRLKSQMIHQGRDLGFDPAGYVVATLNVPELDAMNSPRAADSVAWERRVKETQRTLLTRLSEDPLVLGVAMADDIPGLTPNNRDVILEAPPAGFEQGERDIHIPRVDVSFFAGLHRPILAGRDFNAGDVEGPAGAPHTAVIVNETFVHDVIAGRNAIGQRLRYAPQGTAWGSLDDGGWYEIVGVVGAFGTNPENSARDAAIYHPLAPGELNPIRYAVEVTGDPEAFVPRFRQIAASVDPEATVDATLLAATIRSESLVLRSIFLLIVGLASSAFLLSATGVYALMSFTVAQRTREIGIRTALGARASDIVTAVARRAAVQVGVGLALGAAWGWVLLDNSRNDLTVDVGNIPLTLALTAAVAGCVCLIACARPTLRGLRIQPTEALRES